MRHVLPSFLVLAASAACAQVTTAPVDQALPDAPSSTLVAAVSPLAVPDPAAPYSSSSPAPVASDYSFYPAGYEPQQDQSAAAQAARQSDAQKSRPKANVDLDANGNPIPLDRQQPKRILGFMPNFRTVSAGAVVHPPGWKYNFKIATRQATDYSSFIFLGLTTLTAYGTDAHPSLDTYNGGSSPLYAYLWRGFLDKSDGTYLSAWLLPSIFHEDNRYYPLGDGHSILTRVGYVISRQAVTRTYGGRQTINISSLGGKALTQIISKSYYPPSSSGFSVLATKFAYSAMRDIGFSAIREFYPDTAAHYVRKHREKVAREQSAEDVRSAQSAQPTSQLQPASQP